MVDLRTAVREYFDEVDPPFEVDDLMRPVPTPLGGARRTRRRPVPVAVAAALATIVAVGGVVLLLGRSSPDVADRPVTTISRGPWASLGLPVTAGDTGDRPMIVFGPDGLPVVAFVDRTAGAVQVARCFDEACTAARVVTIAGVPGGEVSPPLLRIADSGETWIAFTRSLEADPWNEAVLVHCSTPECVAADTTVLGPVSVEELAVTDAGNPVLGLYSADAAAEFSVRVCADPLCSLPASERVLASGSPSGALWLGPAGMPSTARLENGALVVAACSAPDCSGDVARREVTAGTVVDPNAVVAAVDGDGRPVILAAIRLEGAAGAGSLVRCLDPECTAFDVVPVPEVVVGSSVAVVPDGTPIAALLGEDGVTTVACGEAECSGETTVTPLGIDGWWTSIGIAPDGRPVVAVTWNSDLAVVRCGDADCSAGLPPAAGAPAESWQERVIAAGTVTGTEYPPGLFVGPDGRVAATFVTSDGPVLITCESPACDAPVEVPLGAGAVQSAAFAADGTPFVAVSAGPWRGPLGLVRCDGPLCRSPERETLVDGVSLWAPPAIALDPTGAPVVAYQNLDDYQVSLVRCDGPSCDSPVATRLEFLADDTGTRWLASSIGLVVGADDRPLLLIASGKGELQLVRCGDRVCTDADVAVVDDAMIGETDTATITAAPDRVPVLAWYGDGTARLARCTDASCTTWDTVGLGPSFAGFLGAQTPGIAFDGGGNPIVGYRLAGDAGVALAVCEDPGCADAWTVPFGPAGGFGLAAADGLPVLAWYARSDDLAHGAAEAFARVEESMGSVETVLAEGAFDEAARTVLADDLRASAEEAGSPADGLLLEAADAIEGGGDPIQELSNVLETLDGELAARDLRLSRCADASCLGR